MKLVGYIKEKKENSFRIPLYANAKGLYFLHTVDERYNITSFIETEYHEAKSQKLYLSKKFDIGSKGAIAFIGKENYLHYNDAPNAIEEIIHYLNEHSALYNINAILDEAMLLKNRIFSDHFVVDNFIVKMNPKNEQIILSFDFPSPKKDAALAENTIVISNDELPKKKERTVILEQESDPEFTKAIKYLNSVDMNFELKLKLRAEERRSKLKMFNYQFKLNQNTAKKKNATE